MAKRKIYGLTHDLDGSPIIRESTTTKIGIGLAKGKDIHVYIDASGKWCIKVGKDVTRVSPKDNEGDTMREVRRVYNELKSKAPERGFPGKLPYFTFSKVSPDGSFEPDFQQIAHHGPLPTEIRVVFLDNDPFDVSYQMWTATEKKCEGDGLNAQRVLSMATTPEEVRLAQIAKEKGERTFPIIDGCWTRGCPFRGKDCKPHGRLLFQLANAPRLGATAYFDTTGFRSIGWIFSSLEKARLMTGHGDPERGFVAGIPFTMCVRPYRVRYEGGKKSGTAYGVWLEFRAEDAVGLKQSLIDQAYAYRTAGLLNAAPPPLDDESDSNGESETSPLPPPVYAAAMASEFYSGDQIEMLEEADAGDDAMDDEARDVISEEQRTAIVRLAKNAQMPVDQLPLILQSFGFFLTADITTDRYEAVCQAIRDWTPSSPDSETLFSKSTNRDRALQLETDAIKLSSREDVVELISRATGANLVKEVEEAELVKVIALLERHIKSHEPRGKRTR